MSCWHCMGGIVLDNKRARLFESEGIASESFIEKFSYLQVAARRAQRKKHAEVLKDSLWWKWAMVSNGFGVPCLSRHTGLPVWTVAFALWISALCSRGRERGWHCRAGPGVGKRLLVRQLYIRWWCLICLMKIWLFGIGSYLRAPLLSLSMTPFQTKCVLSRHTFVQAS